jgi:hypothetical protein
LGTKHGLTSKYPFPYKESVEKRKKATGGGDKYADITVESEERHEQEQVMEG